MTDSELVDTAYEKPRLERVRLVPRENVLTFCKGPSFQGPLVGACNTPGGPAPCQVKGS